MAYNKNWYEELLLKQKNDERKREVIKDKLLNLLLYVAKIMSIDIYYSPDLKNCAGSIYYDENDNINDDIVIQIDNKYKDCPYVVAHEIGHYLSYRHDKNRSENSANKYASELCQSLLSYEEKDILKIFFDISFKERKTT